MDAQTRRAEKEALEYLTRRWSHVLGGRGLPPVIKRRLRGQERFRGIVKGFKLRRPPVDLDLDQVPEELESGGKVIRDLLIEELGDDPRRYFCRRCDGFIDDPRERECGPCQEFRADFFAPAR